MTEETMNRRTVLAFGTYDLLHPGHEYFLRQAAMHGDRLVVIVARDANVEQLKGQRPHDSEEQRRAAVAAVPEVTEALLGYEDWQQHLQVLEDIQPDVICLGYDQKARLPEGSWEVVHIDACEPDRYKSSIIRRGLAKKNTP